MILREEGPYATCARCQHKVPISKMEWDFGRLVCAKTDGFYCSADGKVQGSLELKWAQQAAIWKGEREPEPKLVNPVDPASQLESVPASSGIYE